MRPNFSGTWRANLQRSKLLGPVPQVIEILITKPDDSEERLLFKGLTSGQEVVNYVNGVEVPSCSLWEGTELLIESWMKIGERQSSFRDYWSLSSDGRHANNGAPR